MIIVSLCCVSLATAIQQGFQNQVDFFPVIYRYCGKNIAIGHDCRQVSVCAGSLRVCVCGKGGGGGCACRDTASPLGICSCRSRKSSRVQETRPQAPQVTVLSCRPSKRADIGDGDA